MPSKTAISVLVLLAGLFLSPFSQNETGHVGFQHRHEANDVALTAEESSCHLESDIQNSYQAGSTWNYLTFELHGGESLHSLSIVLQYDPSVVQVNRVDDVLSSRHFMDSQIHEDTINITYLFSEPVNDGSSLFRFGFDILSETTATSSSFRLFINEALDADGNTVEIPGDDYSFFIAPKEIDENRVSFRLDADKTSLKKEEEATFHVTLDNPANLAGGTLTISYDKDLLGFVSCQKGEFLNRSNVMADINSDNPGTIMVSFVTTQSSTATDVFTFTLSSKVNEDNLSYVSLQPTSLYDFDSKLLSSEDASVEIANRYDSLAEAGEPILSSLKVSEEEGTLTLLFSLPEDPFLAAGDFRLVYDSSYLKYDGYDTLGGSCYFDYLIVRENNLENEDGIDFHLIHMNGTPGETSDFLALDFSFVQTCENFSTSLQLSGDDLITAQQEKIDDLIVSFSVSTTNLSHDYHWVTTKEPTCVDDGLQEYVCSKCGKVSDTSTLPATGEHTFGEWTTIQEATCTKEGLEQRTCSVCGYVEERTIPLKEHVYEEWTVVKEPTCGEEGQRELRCVNCGYLKATEPIPATGEHVYGEWEILTPATCDESGVRERTCEVCGKKITETIPALGHDEGEWGTTKEATCEEDGLEELFCTRCGEPLGKTRLIPATGHSFTEWETTKEPTCGSEGTRSRHCTLCGKTETETIPATGEHTWSEWERVKEPTELEQGLERRHCLVCGKTEEREIPETGEHTWSDWSTVKEPTCTEEGLEERTCADCGAKQTRPIDALGHDAGDWLTTKEPSCSNPGEKELRCTRCGEVLDTEEIPATGEHSWSEWETTEEPTCTKAGKEQRTCSICGKEETRNIAPLGHDEGEWVTIKEATCTEDGEKVLRCTRCQTIIDTETIPATGHDEGTWFTVKEASCGEDGMKELRCTKCGKVLRTETIPATGEHSWSNWETTKAATCTENGEETRRCTICGKEETRSTTALGHDEGQWVTTKEPTCSEPGEKELRCTRCGEVLDTEVIPATGHSFGEWTTTKEPTCTEDGLEERVCSVCGEKESRVLPALGHDEGEWVTAKEATCGEDGLRELRCTRCGEVLDTETIPATGEHSWTDWTTTKEATSDSEGIEERTCSICGKTETRSIPKLEESNMNGTVVAILVVGGIIVVVAIGLGIYLYTRRRNI